MSSSHGSRASRAFRVTLQRELPGWISDQILDEGAAARLTERYALRELRKESGHQVARSIFGIGALLIGGGLVAFVAAHWTRLPVPWKTSLLFLVLLALHGVGWWLWRAKNSPRLGEALILLGCGAFGANLALLAQMFHLQRDQIEWLGAWALGSLAVAWAVRSSLVGSLVLVVSLFWFVQSLELDPHALPLYPFLLAIGLLSLAYRTRSVWLQTTCLLSLGASLIVTAGADSESARAAGIAAIVGSLLIWGTGRYHEARGSRRSFAFPDVILGATALGLTAYVFSFHEVRQNRPETDLGGLWIVPVAIAGAVAIALLVAALRSARNDRPERLTILGVLAAAAFLTGSLWIDDPFATILANVAAFAMAGIGIANGVSEERRSAFWLGTLFAVLLVLTRFFEYETSLLAKSLVFISCGVAVVLVGIRFERHLRRQEGARA